MHFSSIAYESDILRICKICFSFSHKVDITVSSFLFHFVELILLIFSIWSGVEKWLV